MGCKDKKVKKFVCYYDPTVSTSSIYKKKTTHDNSDGKSFESVETQKQYILYDGSGEQCGEAQLYEHGIPNNNSMVIYHDLFKLSLGDKLNEQYQVTSMIELPRPTLKYFDLIHSSGKYSFNRLKWEWPTANNPNQKRTLTFYIKKKTVN